MSEFLSSLSSNDKNAPEIKFLIHYLYHQLVKKKKKSSESLLYFDAYIQIFTSYRWWKPWLRTFQWPAHSASLAYMPGLRLIRKLPLCPEEHLATPKAWFYLKSSDMLTANVPLLSCGKSGRHLIMTKRREGSFFFSCSNIQMSYATLLLMMKTSSGNVH